MAKIQNPDDSDSEDVQAQIELRVKQLIHLSLLEIGKKYNLPLLGTAFPEVPHTFNRKIKTNLYTLKIKTDYHQIKLDLTLNINAIHALIKEHKVHQPTWAFLGYLKEEPITIEEIEANANRWKLAELSTQTSGIFPRTLKNGVPYHALFVVAIENKDKLVLDADVTTPLDPPPVPSLDYISGLKSQLRSLIEEDKETPPKESIMEAIQNGHLQIAQDAADLKKKLTALNSYSKKEINEMVEAFMEHARHCLHKALSKE